ncbi:hypothetical protein HELRODRAFT_162449 [Helobdella robusta]|uniref:Uncharacterized protein n=1 Tax=Helobdella robusta TaxID=6412 RepID=T1ESP0_HELRO|nr:hypothetical protein HELRODRAFT_162449 [Helobdella robusta]ESN98975.1 hypothetical protein HELRODRAFT_162449 [Helobdella robusta]
MSPPAEKLAHHEHGQILETNKFAILTYPIKTVRQFLMVEYLRRATVGPKEFGSAKLKVSKEFLVLCYLRFVNSKEKNRMGEKYEWPRLSEVVLYRRKVRMLVHEVIERTPLQLPISWDSVWWAVIMGIEHERIHIETSSVLIRQLPVSLVKRPDGWSYAPTVNYHEAKAYCKWKSVKELDGSSFYRLLSEAEYKILRGDDDLKSGQAANINLIFGSSTWLEDDYNALPGFETHYLYHDYSYSYFEGQYTLVAVS